LNQIQISLINSSIFKGKNLLKIYLHRKRRNLFILRNSWFCIRFGRLDIGRRSLDDNHWNSTSFRL